MRLLVPAAALFRLAIASHWTEGCREPGASGEARRFAIELYRLGDAVMDMKPAAGWPDRDLELVGGLLLAVGDLFAFNSVDWTGNALPGGLPEEEQFKGAIADAGMFDWADDALVGTRPPETIDEWVREFGASIPLGPVPHVSRGETYTRELLESRERPGTSEYGDANVASAWQYETMVATYRRIYDAVVLDGDAVLPFAEEVIGKLVVGISGTRHGAIYWPSIGASAEAILAGLIARRLARSNVLIASAAGAVEARDLNVPSPDEIEQMADVQGVAAWLARMSVGDS